MKTLWLAALLLSSCSWRQRDFEKDLKKGTVEASPQIEAADVELLEKFEVQAAPVEEKKAEEAPKEKPIIKKNPTKVVKAAPKKTEVKTPVAPAKPAVKSLPADYPPELVALNAKAKKVWDLYKPNHQVNSKVFLDIHYLGMTVGKIMATNMGKKMINGKEVWHFNARFKSAPFYSNIYELDDNVDTYVQTENFLSLKYSLIQRESKQDIDDLQLYDRDQMKLFWFYKRKKVEGKAKTKQGEIYIPFHSIDPFSLLFFYQGLPLKDKDIYEIPVINKDKVMVMKSEVEGREQIETEHGTKKAIRLHATTQYSGTTLKSGDMYFWFSDDDKRTLLKAQAKIKIGSVTADIVKN